MRLAAEVDVLAAKLEASRARIVELETRIDIDPLTEIRNRRGFFRELERVRSLMSNATAPALR